MQTRAWRSRRATVIVAAALAVAGVVAAVAYRALAPAEVAAPARAGYPPPVTAPTGVIGALSAAPLIVDGRLRIYATTRQVRADQPVDAGFQRTPYWSYRRWPAQLSAVVAAGTTVVTRWSDGEVVALDAHTGRISWRTAGPRPEKGYEGRRTGSATLYAPVGLYTATAQDGRRVVVVSASAELRGIDPDSGRELWRVSIDGACRADGFTTTDGRFVTVDTCASPQMAEFYDVATGASIARWRPEDAGPVVEVAPVGCAVGGSACAGLRTTSDGRSRGWLVNGGEPAPAPALDPAGSWLIGTAAVTVEDTAVVARSTDAGTELWRHTVGERARLVAVQPGRVHVLTRTNELMTLDANSGAQMSSFVLEHDDKVSGWTPGYVHASDGFVAVERLTEPARPDESDSGYYFTVQPVIFAGT